MNIQIRKAKLEDVIAIADLTGQLGYDSSVLQIKNRLFQISTRNDHCAFVIIINKEIIGWIHAFVTLRIETDTFTEIGGLVVHEKYRKKGFGKMLIEAIYEWSKKQNSFKIRVRSNSIRSQSHTFYERLGFTLIKEQKVFDKLLI